MRTSARAMAQALSGDRAVDLVASFAAPWSRELALAYASYPRDGSEELIELSRQVFLEAAHATSRAAAAESSRALLDLAQAIRSDRSPLAVQGFIALANTLPLLLAGAWHALVMQPGAWQSLRRTPAARLSAIDELLRLASPARVVFRQAVTDVTIGTTRVAAGDEVVLALYDANRSPEQFSDAERFVADRFAAYRTAPDRAAPDRAMADRAAPDRAMADRAAPDHAMADRAAPDHVTTVRASERVAGCRHVGLGLHPHACAGGALVRLALDVATAALLDEFDTATLAGPVTSLGGFAIDGITSLPVVLHRARERTNAEGACPT